MPTLPELETFLAELLVTGQFADDQNGLYRTPPDAEQRVVKTLGLALEPWPGILDWAVKNELDALFLHRPWKLGRTPRKLGVLAYHYAFDERLTTGYNPLLAEALGFSGLEVLGDKEGRPLGMIGNIPPTSLAAFQAQVEAEFGGLAGAYGAADGELTRACVVGAMRPALLYEAAERGAQAYLTGQYRQGAAKAVAETGMAVLELGHKRSEVWGLKALARVLQGQFPGLSTVVST